MRINKSLIAYTPTSGAGSGSVTSVALTAPTGFTVTGSPITTSGTLALSFTTGYGIPPLMTGNSGKFLTTNGTTMSWVNIAGSDVTGAALTEVDDTNVTCTLGGTPATALLRSVSLTFGWAGQLAVSRGGSGASTLTGVLIGNGTSAFTGVAASASQLLRRNSGNTAYEFFSGGNLTSSNDTNVQITLGGTPTGSLINAVSLTMGWTGQLAVGRGGTGASTLTGVVIGNATANMTAVAGTAGQFLRRNTANTAYEFRTLQGGDIAGSELTKTDDTNVTLSLSGTPASALLQPVNLTLGWTGQLSVSRGGTGASTITGVLIGNGTSAVTAVTGTASQLLRRNAANTAYEFFTASLITGNGVADRVAKWTSATNLVDSQIIDNGTNVGIGGSPSYKLDVFGNTNVTGTIFSGNTSSPNGSIMLQDSYTSGHLSNIGSMYSGGNLMLGYCVTPSTSSATAFLSATALSSFPRSAIVVGTDISFYTGAAQTVAIGSSVSTLEVLRMTNAGTLQILQGDLQLPTTKYITWGGAYGTDIPTISGTSGSSNGFLQFFPAGSTSGVKMALRRDGQLALPSYTTSTSFTGTAVATLAVTNAGDVITIGTQETTASGTYTPTWTGLANVDSVTAFACQYLRVGSTVTVSGWVTINATVDNTPTSLSFSLPINSDTSVVNRLNGTGVQQGGGAAAALYGYGTNFGEFAVSPLVDTSVNYSFHFTYRIV